MKINNQQYFKQENWFESLLNYHWAIQKSPNHIIAKIGLSLSMMHREDFQGARIILEKLIKNENYRIGGKFKIAERVFT